MLSYAEMCVRELLLARPHPFQMSVHQHWYKRNRHLTRETRPHHLLLFNIAVSLLHSLKNDIQFFLVPFFPSKYSKLLLEDNCLYSQVSRKEWHWKKCIRITKKPQLHPHNCQTLVSGCAPISETSCLLTSHASLSPFFSWYFSQPSLLFF